MALQDEIDNLTTKVEKIRGAAESAIAFINGFQAILDAAIAEALARGATPAQLAAISAAAATLDSEGDAIAAAIAANPGL